VTGERDSRCNKVGRRAGRATGSLGFAAAAIAIAFGQKIETVEKTVSY
jgi:hypothetical protein